MARRLALALVLLAAAVPGPATTAAAQTGRATYYFAEGTLQSPFAQDLVLLNPGTTGIAVSVEYQFADGAQALTRS